jgi:hypothetical protein
VHEFELVLQITVNQNTVSNKMKTKAKKYTAGTVPKSNRKIEKQRQA